jgi:hypothetical protein
MKILTYISLIAFIAMSFTATLFSQETDAEIERGLYNHSLTANLVNGADIAKILYHATSQKKMNKQFFNDQLNLMGNSLESAKKNLEIIQSSLSAAEKEQVKKNMASLQKRIDTAIQNNDLLSDEFALGTPNMAMMKEYISNIFYNLKEAELVDHIAIKNTLNIEELKEPLKVEQKEAKANK